MPLVNARIAAELIGRDRSTLIRAIERGKLSASKDERGRYLIDPAELERAYGTLRRAIAPSDADTDALPQGAFAAAERMGALAREVELLRETLSHERDVWERERTFLHGLVERRDEQLRLLTDERPTSRSGFWQRLMGRQA